MFKKVIGLILVSLLLVAVFFQVPSKALSERIVYLMDKNIVEGDETGDLKLDKPITRASLAKILTFALGEEEKAATLKTVPSAFTDMVAGGWANGYVNVVSTEGIVNGYPDGRFGPSDSVTYEQAIKMFAIVANGGDIPGAEAAKGKGWAIPYIQKASQLGLLKHLNISDYKAIAPREDVFDILYEVLKYKENLNVKGYRGMVMEVTADNKAKVLIMNSDDKTYKKEDIAEFTFKEALNPEDYLGLVIDFKVGKDKVLSSPVVAKEYETYQGPFTIGRDGLLYMEGSKRGLVIDENSKSRLNDSLVNIVHNGENYSLKLYRNEIKDNAEFGIVTMHNSKVVFIRSYSFKDIAPVSKVRDGIIYVIRDSSPRSEARQNVIKALELTKDGLKAMEPSRISTDDVLHIYKDGYVIVGHEKITDARFKVETRANEKVLTIASRSYPLKDVDNFRAILNINFEEYDTIYPSKDIRTLKSMEGSKAVVLLDLFGRVQLVRGDIQEKEELMVVTGVTANRIRVLNQNNQEQEIVDNFAIDIFENGRALKMNDLNRGDLIYVFTRDGEARGITVVKRENQISSDMQDVLMNGSNYAIDLTPQRGRYATIKTSNGTFEFIDKSYVLVKEGLNYRFTTIAEIANKASASRKLKASFVTFKDFKDQNTGSKIPASDRSDLIHTVVFSNFEEQTVVSSTEIVKMTYGYNPKIDTSIVGSTKAKDRVEIKVVRNSILEELLPGEIVKFDLNKDGDVIGYKKLIPSDARIYEIKSILEKDGVIRLEIERVDTKEKITKYLAKYAVVFGQLKEGANMKMSVDRDDIIAIDIVK